MKRPGHSPLCRDSRRGASSSLRAPVWGFLQTLLVLDWGNPGPTLREYHLFVTVAW